MMVGRRQERVETESNQNVSCICMTLSKKMFNKNNKVLVMSLKWSYVHYSFLVY